MSTIQLRIRLGGKYPYDASDSWWNRETETPPPPPKDWAHQAARGILDDLKDRRAIKNSLENIDEDIRRNIVETIAEIIRQCHAATAPNTEE